MVCHWARAISRSVFYGCLFLSECLVKKLMFDCCFIAAVRRQAPEGNVMCVIVCNIISLHVFLLCINMFVILCVIIRNIIVIICKELLS